MLRVLLIFTTVVYYVEAACDVREAEYIKDDIRKKLSVADGMSAGSSYGAGGAGAGLHIYVNPSDVTEDTEYSLQAKVVIHEYIHVLQQHFLAGSTSTEGPVSMRSDATSQTRFQVINKCNVPTIFETYAVNALNSLPNDMKLLDIPLYVILIPESGCDVSYTDAIFNEIYGADCPGLDASAGNILINENHAFAEGEAEYYSLNDYIGLSLSTFDGPAYWTQKLADDKTGCQVPGNEQFIVGDGSSCTIDNLIEANIGSHCYDNNIGEVSFSEFQNWCAAKGISDCTHKALMRVWIGAGTSGWCNAFEAEYGFGWGSYVCFLESALQIGNKDSCVEANVPCMSYINPTSAGGDNCQSGSSGDSSSSEDDMFVYVAIGIGVGVLLVLAVLFVLCCKFKKK